MPEFSGKVVMVTGASRGIGFAVSRLFASAGAQLVMVARNRPALDNACGEVGGLSPEALRPLPLTGDLGAPGVAAAIIDAAKAHFGRVDVVANIAGAFPTARLEDTDDALFAATVQTNLMATFTVCRAVFPMMRERGQGTIVNMSSTAARFPTPGLSVYGAAKAGIEAMTRALAIEGAPSIRVNAVSAGPTLTGSVRDLMRSDATGAVDAVTKTLPLGRLAEPEEIAEAVVFLASRRASVITGQVLHANCGGFMA